MALPLDLPCMATRSKSSQRWLKEHFSDPFVKKAQAEGLRSRAAYKLEELVARDRLLKPGMTVVDHWMFRVTRNADLTVEEEEADDLLVALEMELRRRRFGRAVRLEIEAGASDRVLELLVSELDLTEDDISFHRAPLDLTGLWALHRLDRPELKRLGPLLFS